MGPSYPESLDEIDEPDRLWLPHWLDEPRGFIDQRSRRDETLSDILNLHLPAVVSDWNMDDHKWTFTFEEELTIIASNAEEPMTLVATSSLVNRKWLDHIRAELRSMAHHTLDPASGPIALAVRLLQLVEETAALLQLWKNAFPAKEHFKLQLGRGKGQWRTSNGWDASTVVDWKSSLLHNPFGVNLSTIKDTAAHLLGKPIQDICLDIPAWLRIIHIEPIFRSDLTSRFIERKESMIKELSRLSHSQLRRCISHDSIASNPSHQDLVEQLATPKVTFHGSSRRNIASIVRYGFIKPGDSIGNTGSLVATNAGATYGAGIYSSPDPVFASHYAGGCIGDGLTADAIIRPSDIPGMRLFVCATLMGRAVSVTRDATRGKPEISDKSAHSHVSPDGLQYIVFDSTQIIPCYVLHLDYGAEGARQAFDRIAENPAEYFEQRKKASKNAKAIPDTELLFPGEVKAKKEALKAAARKWFPYGYGPRQGVNFVVEEIGEVSDDEEHYGDYQHMRNEQEDEIRQKRLNAGGSWFDEYQTVRKSAKELNPK